jgi:hypothetical protein
MPTRSVSGAARPEWVCARGDKGSRLLESGVWSDGDATLSANSRSIRLRRCVPGWDGLGERENVGSLLRIWARFFLRRQRPRCRRAAVYGSLGAGLTRARPRDGAVVARVRVPSAVDGAIGTRTFDSWRRSIWTDSYVDGCAAEIPPLPRRRMPSARGRSSGRCSWRAGGTVRGTVCAGTSIQGWELRDPLSTSGACAPRMGRCCAAEIPGSLIGRVVCVGDEPRLTCYRLLQCSGPEVHGNVKKARAQPECSRVAV